MIPLKKILSPSQPLRIVFMNSKPDPLVSAEFARNVLDSLSAHVAILDMKGKILDTNAAWKKFAQSNDLKMRPDMTGINYLQVCSSSFGTSSKEADRVFLGITALINGSIDEFVIEYPCHSPEEERWFYMRATRLRFEDELRIVVSHENITALKLMEKKLVQQKEALKNREKELEIQKEHLEETNIALKVLLNQRDKDKEEMENNLVCNIKEQLFPYLKMLQSSPLNQQQHMWTEVIRSSLEKIISPLVAHFSALQLQLTPSEVQIATLIRDGRTTKEIASIQGCSVDAIEFHRKNIRKKLNLTHSKINLRTYLRSITNQ